MLFDLKGKVAVVTGSSRGIGRAIAERMAEAGAKVVVSSRKLDSCQEVVQGIVARGGEAIAVQCHIGDRAQVKNLVETAVKTWGKLDILVCNAASNPYFGPLEFISDEAFDKILHNNVKSTLWLCNAAIPQMAERGEGAVIIISSVASIKGNALLGAYGISKAADLGLMMNMAVEWGPKNVRVNAISPGIIRTDFAKALWENPQILDPTIDKTPLRRIGEVDDVAGVAIMLASRAGAFITGQNIVVDGGGTINSAT